MNYKRFKDISEITDVNQKNRFQDFWELNKLIESWIDREQVYKAYSDVIFWEIEFKDYSELHFKIKYLLDEVNVALNSILDFYDYKVTSYKKLTIDFIENNPYLFYGDGKDTFLNFLNKSQQWTFIELFITGGNNKNVETIKLWYNDTEKEIYEKLVLFDKRRREVSKELFDEKMYESISNILWVN